MIAVDPPRTCVRCHIVITLGFIITAAMAIPAGKYNLDDNTIIQRIAFWMTLAIWVLFG